MITKLVKIRNTCINSISDRYIFFGEDAISPLSVYTQLKPRRIEFARYTGKVRMVRGLREN
ncbi:MAG: hypothetical protein RMX96_10620 [Nostoc sp. ChiSLP02]|nr:hypothetical protein [Nostoc sp. DedSLP05]MDZ8101417.1 hypothetical protein [Nostoc sp. DedSLP01]MDZ8185293.1 hypothetical protein [Nostoc sp. ChiSLP02]